MQNPFFRDPNTPVHDYFFEGREKKPPATPTPPPPDEPTDVVDVPIGIHLAILPFTQQAIDDVSAVLQTFFSAIGPGEAFPEQDWYETMPWPSGVGITNAFLTYGVDSPYADPLRHYVPQEPFDIYEGSPELVWLTSTLAISPDFESYRISVGNAIYLWVYNNYPPGTAAPTVNDIMAAAPWGPDVAVQITAYGRVDGNTDTSAHPTWRYMYDTGSITWTDWT